MLASRSSARNSDVWSASRVFGAIALAVVVTRLPGLFGWFYNGDEPVYSALGTRIVDGALPYVGAVDHKPPGISVLYAIVYAIAGRNNLVAIRLVLMAVVAATAHLVGELGRRAIGADEGRAAGIAYAIASTWGLARDVQAANAELFLNLPLAAAALACNARRAFACGVLVGTAAMFKHQAALAGPAFAYVLWRSERSFARLVVLAAGGACMPAAIVALYAYAGHLDALAFWGWSFNFEYMSKLDAGDVLANAARNTAITALLWTPLLACVRRTADTAACLAWLVAMLVAVGPGGRFFLHYYLMLLPPLCAIAAPGLLARVRWRTIAAAIVTALCVADAATWPLSRPIYAAWTRAYREIADYVDACSTRDDHIFVWGQSPEIYHLADRVMATPFPWVNYHTGRIWGTSLADRDAIGTEAHIVPRAWDEMMADLEADPPLFVIDAAAGGLDDSDRHPIARYPRLAAFVAAHYERAAVVAGVPIYRRRGA